VIAMSAIAEVIETMDRLVSRWDSAGDYRAVFARSYRSITRRMERAIESGAFEDNGWVEDLDVRFAHEYFAAVDAYEAGSDSVPACWRLAFDGATGKHTLVLQDLLLGMNAHILHDLPISLDKVGIAPGERQRRKRDHERVNDILSEMIDEVQREAAQHYSVVLGLLDRWSGPQDELLTDVGIRAARASAWQAAVELADAPDEAARASIRIRLDRSTFAVSRRIFPARSRLRRVVPLWRRWDQALAAMWPATKRAGGS